MRVGIFYLSQSRNHDDSKIAVRLPNGGEVFVRVEEFTGNVSTALDAAKPRGDEMVMNTHPLRPRQDKRRKAA